MNRRTFFGALAAAIAARKIPIDLEPIKLAPIFSSQYMHCPDLLGFKISKELYEDDMYAAFADVRRQLAAEVDKRMMEDLI